MYSDTQLLLDIGKSQKLRHHSTENKIPQTELPGPSLIFQFAHRK